VNCTFSPHLPPRWVFSVTTLQVTKCSYVLANEANNVPFLSKQTIVKELRNKRAYKFKILELNHISSCLFEHYVPNLESEEKN
jgi:hypothetical protein